MCRHVVTMLHGDSGPTVHTDVICHMTRECTAGKDDDFLNGDFPGSWEGLDKSVGIMNWNFDRRTESLKYFTDRGHPQIIAGYYDNDAAQIGRWLDTVRENRISGVTGVMYTTWKKDYSQLRFSMNMTI